MTTLVWIAAFILAVAGLVSIARGAVIAGILLIIVACLVGPGGYSLWRG